MLRARHECPLERNDFRSDDAHGNFPVPLPLPTDVAGTQREVAVPQRRKLVLCYHRTIASRPQL
jgi:hypothetical protein